MISESDSDSMDGEILWIRPVAREAGGEDVAELIDAVRLASFTPRITALKEGPPHLEFHTYEHEALGGILELVQEAERANYLAAIIGCFYDGGLREARELVDMPIVGMGEASTLLAASLGHRFSIIVGRRKWIPKMNDNLVLYGLDRKLASFRSIDMTVTDVLASPEEFYERTIAVSRTCVEEDGAEVIVLSEIASPQFWERARRDLKVPVVDPGVACWKWAEMAASLYSRTGLSHSKTFGYEPPPIYPTVPRFDVAKS